MDNSKICHLENPWTHTDSTMTWRQIKTWADNHIHRADRADWLRAAQTAVENNDAATLGKMIIGS